MHTVVSRRIALVSVLAVRLLPAGAAASAQEPKPAGRAGAAVTLVSAGCLWRKHYTFFPPKLSAAAARELGVDPEDIAARRRALKWRLVRHRSAGPLCAGLNTPPPPAGWACRARGSFSS